MQGAALALRQPCRAHNAFNLAASLSSTFCTASRLRQDTTAATKGTGERRHRQSTPSGGTFASYVALSEQFSSGAEQRGQRTRTESVRVDHADLAYRQALVEDASQTAPSVPPSPARRQRWRFEPETPQGRQSADRTVRRKTGPLVSEDKIKKYSSHVPHYQGRKTVAAPDAWKLHMQWIGRSVHELSQKVKANELPSLVEPITKERIDYEAKAIPPAASSREQPIPIPTAVGISEGQGLRGHELLDREIAQFAKFIEPTPVERAARQAVADEICAYIKEALPKKTPFTDVFGSERTGLALATSDIDIRVHHGQESRGIPHYYQKYGNVMMALYKNMRYQSGRFTCVTIRLGNYPIINAQHLASGIPIQIVCAPPTLRQEEWTRRFLEDLPHLRALYAVLRTALGIRGLADVFNGGTGSYGLLMMLVAALKRRSSQPPTSASAQLRHFLNFYAHFNTRKYGLAIHPTAKPFLKHDGTTTPIKTHIEAARRRGDRPRAGQWAIGRIRPLQPYLLCLQDPAEDLNDLGRKSNAIKHLQETCRYLDVSLRKSVHAVDSGNWKAESMLEPLIGRCHEVYYEQRRRVEEYGQEVLERQSREAGGEQQSGQEA